MSKTNPWDRPTTPPDEVVSNSSLTKLHAAIGAAVSQWSMVEYTLSIMFTRCFGGWPAGDFGAHQAVHLYAVLPSTASRINSLKTLGASYFAKTPDRAALFKKLLTISESLLGRRNDIAHGVCQQTRDCHYFLVEPGFNVKYDRWVAGSQGYAYTVQDIENFTLFARDLLLELNVAITLFDLSASIDQWPVTPLRPHLQQYLDPVLGKSQDDQ